MAKKWQKNELETLKQLAGSKSLKELAREVGREEPEIRAKLDELGLKSNESLGGSLWYDDPFVDRYQKALDHLNRGRWADARKELEQIVTGSDLQEVAERARLMLRVCEARLAQGEVAADDPFLQAVFEKNRGNYDQALRICEVDGRLAKDDRFAYLAASIHALAERREDAVAALKSAVKLNSKNRVYAYHDPDFENLLDHPELEQLFEAS